MKSILTTLFIIILSIVYFSFTTDKEKKNTYTLSNSITTDARFVSLLQDQYHEMNQVSDIEALANLDPDNLDDDDINTIASLLGYSSKSAYANSLVEKSIILKELDNEYNLSSYSNDQIIEFGIIALTGNNENSRSNRTIEIGGEGMEINPVLIDPCDCKRKQLLCIAAAAATAVSGHLDCATLDATTLIGLVCHGPVAINHAAAVQVCNALYITCITSCK